MRVGIFSGTFDPVHHGHMAFAEEAIKRCHLDQVVFLPEPTPRFKTGVTSIEHRQAMLELATKEKDYLRVLVVGDKQFTVADTLPRLRSSFEGSELVIMMGSDVFLNSLPRWPGVEDMPSTVDLIVGVRGGEDLALLRSHAPSLAASFKITFVTTGLDDVSASKVRTGNLGWVSQEVHDYSKRNNLYLRHCNNPNPVR
jgi:nicotinate-nucleotide adenylyltransferase